MAKQFYADGVSGRVAIFDPANANALTNPRANLQSVFFHSDLDYVGVAKVIDVTVVHPARAKSAETSEQHDYAIPNPVSGELDQLAHNLGYQPNALVFVGDDMLPANTQIQAVGSSFRTVAIEVNATEVKLFETAWIYQDSLPQIQKSYKIVLFTQPIAPSGVQTLRIEPTQFIASRGKLNTAFNYLRRVATNPMFWFSKGKTADVANGSFRIVTANGSTIDRTPYNGSFLGVPGIGVEV